MTETHELEDRGHLRQREADEVVQNEDRALFEIEACETPVELVALGDRELVAPEAWFGLGDHTHFNDGSLVVPSRMAMAGSDKQPVEPRVDGRRIAQPADVSPCIDERLLGCVLRSVSIPQDQASDRIQSAE